MVQIKVPPEELEQVAKNFRDVKLYLEQMHKDLYNQTEYISSKWSGATSQRFYQDFNEAKPKMFTVLMEFDKIAEELENAAKKFRKADEEEQKAMEERINAKMWADIGGELSGAYDASRAIDGKDPSNGEKVGWFDRTVAGVMVVGSIFQVGKLGKIKKVADTIETADKVKEAAAALKAKRQAQMATNRATGKAFEKEVYKDFSSEVDVAVEQITLKTNKTGTRTRLDFLGADKDLEGIRIVEAKGSPTAPLTKKQEIAIPEIEEYGATVVGKGKPPFVGGTEIPPTKVEIRRKQ
ncbi:WXG100 family type VII secretion target [Bacillus cereus]|nr:WXG100 family type VII secretion target [Bacillus cereus]